MLRGTPRGVSIDRPGHALKFESGRPENQAGGTTNLDDFPAIGERDPARNRQPEKIRASTCRPTLTRSGSTPGRRHDRDQGGLKNRSARISLQCSRTTSSLTGRPMTASPKRDDAVETRVPAARSRDGFGDGETQRSRSVARSRYKPSDDAIWHAPSPDRADRTISDFPTRRRCAVRSPRPPLAAGPQGGIRKERQP